MDFNESLSIVREAMKDVKQEMIIIIDGVHHIVYIHDISMPKTGEIAVDFSCLSEEKEVLWPHVVECVKIQINELKGKHTKWKLSNLFSRT